jgi:hypothetical protein
MRSEALQVNRRLPDDWENSPESLYGYEGDFDVEEKAYKGHSQDEDPDFYDEDDYEGENTYYSGPQGNQDWETGYLEEKY